MNCTSQLLPTPSMDIERTNSDHQFDYDDIDFVYVNGIKVPIVEQVWYGGCNYDQAIAFGGHGPLDRCFVYEGSNKEKTCIELTLDTTDQMYKCYYEDIPGAWEYVRDRFEDAIVTNQGVAEASVKTRRWVQPRAIYRSTKVLVNPEECLHEAHNENMISCEATVENENNLVSPQVNNVVRSTSVSCLTCNRRV